MGKSSQTLIEVEKKINPVRILCWTVFSVALANAKVGDKLTFHKHLRKSSNQQILNRCLNLITL